MITLTNIEKYYQQGPASAPVLNDISLTIADGDLLAIVGASGSGKTTLMNIIGLLDKPDQGQYKLQPRDGHHHCDIMRLTEAELAILRNRTFGFVFQQFNLLPRYTAIQNVALPLLYRHISMSEALISANQVLKKLNMDRYAKYYPTELSGGQQQRIAIARALVGEPDIILADEPTGALDSATGDEMMQLFLALNEAGRTIILVTHDEALAARCHKQIKLVDGRVSDA